MKRYPLKWLTDEKRKQLERLIRDSLPTLYNFEIEKTLQRLSDGGAKRVCLQFPEGLMLYSSNISRIIQAFGDEIEYCIIFGDVTYGACCIDDLKARNTMNSDYLVHYAHSCLIPLDNLVVKCLYVFVEINLDARDVTKRLVKALPPAICEESTTAPTTPNISTDAVITDKSTDIGNQALQPKKYLKRNIAIMSTIQFSKCAHACARILKEEHWPNDNIEIPQEAPLSAGETLGCTSVRLADDVDMCIFISDGRFHIESAMIQNPHVKFYKYDPFMHKLYAEYYDLPRMLKNRSDAIARALEADKYFIILSTLGRQGCPGIVDHLRELILTERKNSEVDVVVLLLAELMPATLEQIAAGADGKVCFVNVGCPRLSIDWGTDYKVNVVNSYELVQGLRRSPLPLTSYTMDYFSSRGGEWSNAPYRSTQKKVSDIKSLWEKKKNALVKNPPG